MKKYFYTSTQKYKNIYNPKDTTITYGEYATFMLETDECEKENRNINFKIDQDLRIKNAKNNLLNLSDTQ